VAVVQYTYTRKQYSERHKTNNTKNTKIYRTTQKIHRAKQVRLRNHIDLQYVARAFIVKWYIFCL